MAKIGLRYGHSINCKGAISLLDEMIECREVFNELRTMLPGHTIVDCCSHGRTPTEELNEGTNKANNNHCDFYITIHANSAANATANGTEVWLYDKSDAITQDWANKFLKNMENLGFTNRGIKYSTGLHDLNATVMPAMILELFFVSNGSDCTRFKTLGYHKIAEAISKAIDPVIGERPVTNKPLENVALLLKEAQNELNKLLNA